MLFGSSEWSSAPSNSYPHSLHLKYAVSACALCVSINLRRTVLSVDPQLGHSLIISSTLINLYNFIRKCVDFIVDNTQLFKFNKADLNYLYNSPFLCRIISGVGCTIDKILKVSMIYKQVIGAITSRKYFNFKQD